MPKCKLINVGEPVDSKHFAFVQRKAVRKLIEHGEAVWIEEHVLAQRTTDAPKGPRIPSRDGYLERIASLKGIKARFLSGGMSRTETNPVKVNRFQAARVGHQ